MKTKRFLCLFLAVMILLSIVPFTAISTTAAVTSVAITSYDGSGTKSDPYIANTASELFGFVHSDKNIYIRLGADMTLSGGLHVEANINIDMNGKELNIKTNTMCKEYNTPIVEFIQLTTDENLLQAPGIIRHSGGGGFDDKDSIA